MVLSASRYKEQVVALLTDPAYKELKRDPTHALERKTRQLIKSSTLPEDTQRQLAPRENSSRVPRLYGKPKIHKPGMPLRPIVSAVNSATHPLAKYLAKDLQPLVEHAESYVRDSTHFVEKLKGMKLNTGDMLISLDVVSLFTNIPVAEALDVLREKYHQSPDTIDLVRHCMGTTYFLYDDRYYKQVQGAPMGSPLSPVLANLYMTDLEIRILESAPLKPRVWLRYVDDTFIVWQHGADTLAAFLDHTNSVHANIQFTMETEADDQLPFLDCLVKRKSDGSLGHTVYRKPTHTDRYLSALSHHHPTQIRSVANTLASRSLRIADTDHLEAERRTLHEALLKNGFPNRLIHKAWQRQATRKEPPPDTEEREERAGTALLPYVKGTTDQIAKLLRAANIRTIFTTDTKLGQMVNTGKDRIHLEAKGVYEIPCGDCSQTYVGQTGRYMSTRLKEHRRAVDHLETTSSLAQHVTATGHSIDFEGMEALTSIESRGLRTLREAVEIERRPHNMNKRDDSLHLPHAWKPAMARILVPPRRREPRDVTTNSTRGQDTTDYEREANCPAHNTRAAKRARANEN